MKKRILSFLTAALILFTAIIIPAAPARAEHVTQLGMPVSGGASHSLAIKDDGHGTIYGWGSNEQSQLGKDKDDVKNQPSPEPLDGESNEGNISVAAGYDFSIALRFDGGVYSMGTGGTAPVYRVPLLTNIIAIAAGYYEGLALDKDGNVWQWAKGAFPVKLQNLKGVAAIEAGGLSFFALTYSGEVWAWGSNSSGQLGDGTTNDATAPKRIKSLANIICISAGPSHCLAISYDGSVYAWGSNTYGQLGDGTKAASYRPVKAIGLKKTIQVSAGNNTSMALTEDHALYTWGHGEYGQLGDGTTTISVETPTKITTVDTPVYITSGTNHNFYLSDTGNLYTWGRNENQQLGTGLTENATNPMMVLNGLPKNPPPATGSNPFADASAWAVPELTKLYDLDILPPMLFGRYKENVTRAEFASMLVILYETIKGQVISYPDKTNFEDITDHVFEPEIRKAYEIHLVDGVSETRFNPEGLLTRQEAAKMFISFVCIAEGF